MITSILLFLESIGTGELMVVMLFVLLFFGSEKIPDLAKGLGKGMRQLKDAMNGVQSEITQGMHDVENSVKEEIPKIETNPLSQPITKIESEVASVSTTPPGNEYIKEIEINPIEIKKAE